MAYIEKKQVKGGVRYYVRYKDPSRRRKTEGGFRLKKDADAALKRIEAEIANGTYGKKDDITFSVFSEKWIKDHASLKKSSTRDDYVGVVTHHLIPHFGPMILGTVTPADVQEYVTGKREAGTHARTLNKTLMVLKMMFKHAVIWGYLDDNPAQYVERPRAPYREMDYLEPHEVQRLLEAASPDFYPLLATAILTGVRQAELLAIKWGDMDLERGVVFIRRSYHQRHGFTSTKTKRGERAVFLSPELTKILSEHAHETCGNPNDLVFSKDGKPLAAGNMVRDAFWPTLERAGIRRIRWHDLRHTYSALMISMGENIKFVSQQLGHTSTRTTWDIYAHLLPEVSEGSGKRLDAVIFSEKVVPFAPKNSVSGKTRPNISLTSTSQ